VHQSSVSHSINRDTEALLTLREGVIRFLADLEMTNLTFREISGFPRFIVCVDGIHISITKCRNHPEPELFCCRKGYLSMNAQVVVGQDHTIL
jgi:hypothetical protein